MSFSFNVKEEIISVCNDYNKIRSCFYGMLTFCKTFNDTQIILQTENCLVADTFSSFADKLLKKDNIVKISSTDKRNKVILYSLIIDDKEIIQDIFLLYGLNADDCNKINIFSIGKKKFISSFVAGAFLVCGSINDPLKEYHLEFVISQKSLLEELSALLENYSIITKQVERRNSQILYIKESENIEDLLTFMGATKASLEIMNVKILKDVRNKINRAVNCDNANIEKSVKAAQQQIEDIIIIQNSIGLEKLTDSLREIAVLRLENPDFNLKELAQNLIPPISRSGANHRLCKLHKIATELKP